MKLDDVRAYAQHVWHVLTELEHAHWARELSEHGPLSTCSRCCAAAPPAAARPTRPPADAAA